ncbi:hypothetical protein T492DRAFT_841097 [Pavlovales sp. CCMP2436]|nr:hypothetical protein T492DRAFT_841097 [Pavlovales sp. CCMP2436]
MTVCPEGGAEPPGKRRKGSPQALGASHAWTHPLTGRAYSPANKSRPNQRDSATRFCSHRVCDLTGGEGTGRASTLHASTLHAATGRRIELVSLADRAGGLMDAGPESPPPKRRRLASARTVLRPASELRVSLERLYARLQTEPRAADDGAGDLAGDESALGPELVIVHVHGARSQRSFRCIRSILASGSRPLSAMLYGSDGMCMLETQGSAIRLRDVEPGTFELLLLYLHGKAVQLDEADATALYMLADFYDIASLREACCEMLETCIRPSTVCRWLDLARELNCARLADRCIKMLQAELILIEATEPQFR